MAFLRNLWSGVKTSIGLQPKAVNGKPVNQFIMPLDTAPSSKMFGTTRNVIGKVGGFLKKELLPSAGSGVKGIAKSVGKTYLAVSLAQSAYEGKVKPAGLRTVAGITSFALNPLVAAGTFLTGFGKDVKTASVDTTKKFYQEAQGNKLLDMISNKPSNDYGKSQIYVNDVDDAFKTKFDYYKDKMNYANFVNPSPTLNVSMPSSPPINVSMGMPSGGGVSFSPSVSAGGGMGEILPLMLLLAGGTGLAGYIAGKKRRKKYKRRKKRK